mmetsp:Transcript_44272/g.44914  ORF Transcript_44272/g.44914 Transcript_44272/m.44914 type:complete len:86 (-) Transcript_44272:9-266(-)
MKKEFIDIPRTHHREEKRHITRTHTHTPEKKQHSGIPHSTYETREEEQQQEGGGIEWNGIENGKKMTPNQKLLLLLLFRVIRDSY